MKKEKASENSKILKSMTALAAAFLLALCACIGGGTGQVKPTIQPEPVTPYAKPTEFITAEPTNFPTTEPTDVPTAAPTTEPTDMIKNMLNEMTLEEKVGQLFIIRPESLDDSFRPDQAHGAARYCSTDCNEKMAGFLAEHPAGGIAFFGKNIVSPAQTENFIKELQNASKIPLFIAVDEEGGTVARIANSPAFNVPRFESAQAIGNTGDAAQAYAMYSAIGSYLSELGFNLDFAPVADVNSNPNNPVIGQRAFGSTPALVSKMVNAAIDGLHAEGVAACIKHFPGHGDTAGDTHEGYVALEKTWTELAECELIPFENALKKTDMIMAAHITLTKASTDRLPCSLSYDTLTLHLRGEMGYEGVIITDALAMGAIIQNYTSAESAALAFNAGADILLMPYDYAAAFNGILSAVRNGEITEQRLNESVERILRLKAKLGIISK